MLNPSPAGGRADDPKGRASSLLRRGASPHRNHDLRLWRGSRWDRILDHQHIGSDRRIGLCLGSATIRPVEPRSSSPLCHRGWKSKGGHEYLPQKPDGFFAFACCLLRVHLVYRRLFILGRKRSYDHPRGFFQRIAENHEPCLCRFGKPLFISLPSERLLHWGRGFCRLRPDRSRSLGIEYLANRKPRLC